MPDAAFDVRDTQVLLPEDPVEAKRQLAIRLLEVMPAMGVELSLRLLIEVKGYWSIREMQG